MPKHLTVDDTADFVTVSQIGADNGVAQLGADGKVPDDQLPAASTGSVDSVNGQIGNVVLTSTDVGALPTAALGAPSGAAVLDGSQKLVSSQLPTTLVLTSSLGANNGVATLDGSGKLTGSQAPSQAVTSVAGKTGAVTLVASDAGALATSTRGATNGVASLDGTTKIPIAQIPSLLTLYQPVPGATPAKPGQMLTAIAGGSNSTQWTEPLVYTATSSGSMPTGVPQGSLCVRTDLLAIYQYSGTTWVDVVPTQQPWQTFPLPSGTRGYNGNAAAYLPKWRKVGDQVWFRGRIELNSLANFASGYTLTVPDGCEPLVSLDLIAASTTGSGQIGVARWQINPDGSMVFFAGTGPNPATPWLGIVGTYMVD